MLPPLAIYIYSFYVLKHSISFHFTKSPAPRVTAGWMNGGMRRERMRESEKMKSVGVVTEASDDKLRKS
jgi:hypothetical protein